MLLNCDVGEDSCPTARRSNQCILKEISPEYSSEGLILKLKLQYFGHWCEELTHFKRPWCWEWLKAGGEGDNRGWDGWMGSPTQWAWVWLNSRSWWWTGRPGVLQSMGSQRVGHDWAIELIVCSMDWREEKTSSRHAIIQQFSVKRIRQKNNNVKGRNESGLRKNQYLKLRSDCER